jgi:hypothetical protein
MIIAHQPGSEPLTIPEQIPNPAFQPAPMPQPKPVPKEPVKLPEKIPAQNWAPPPAQGAAAVPMHDLSRQQRWAQAQTTYVLDSHQRFPSGYAAV